MTQNSKSQRGQIFYEEYGEVGLKVPLSRKSRDFQAISAPQKSWRSSFRKFRKNLSRPEIQVRIFLSIILVFGGVLLTGYATNEVMFESGANRTLKIFGLNALKNLIASKKSRNSGTNNDPEQSDGEEGNSNNSDFNNEENEIEETVVLLNIAFGADIIPESGGKISVYNNKMYSTLSESEKTRAQGEIQGHGSTIKGIIWYKKLSVTVPALEGQSELQLLFCFLKEGKKHDFKIFLKKIERDGQEVWEVEKLLGGAYFWDKKT